VALDPRGDDVEPQAAAEVDDQSHEPGLTRVALDPVDERAVDPEDVDREVTEVRRAPRSAGSRARTAGAPSRA
jgi:hypothetical protein